VEKAHANQNQ